MTERNDELKFLMYNSLKQSLESFSNKQKSVIKEE